MSGCGGGRATLKSYGETAIVALQGAVKKSRQSDTILENSPKGDNQSKWSSRERSKGSSRNDTHVEDVWLGKLTAVSDYKLVPLGWFVSNHHEVQSVSMPALETTSMMVVIRRE